MGIRTIRLLTVATIISMAQLAQGQENGEPVEPVHKDPPAPTVQTTSQPGFQPRPTTHPNNTLLTTPLEPSRPTSAINYPPIQWPGPREYPVDAHELQRHQTLLQTQLLATQRELEKRQAKNLPPLENGKLHAYRLQHIDPKLLAETLESFLGTNQLRLVPDVENNILLTYSTEEVSEQISDLVKVLDAEKESATLDASNFFQAKEKTPSLQVRIFWLADGIGELSAEEYLPASVIEAVRRLGLQDPQLVSQSATTVAGNQGDRSDFQFRFPALIGGQSVLFESSGALSLGPQPQLDLHVSIQSPQPIELAGTLSAPLGHYMVLGTTNYAAGGHVARGRRASQRAGGGGISPFSGASGGRAVSSGGESSVAVEDNSEPTPKPTTSRFAFVVQVVEAESFAPEDQSTLKLAPNNQRR